MCLVERLDTHRPFLHQDLLPIYAGFFKPTQNKATDSFPFLVGKLAPFTSGVSHLPS